MPDLIKDTRYLRMKEAAHYVGLSARTLEKLRVWADRGNRASTSDPNNANVPPPVRRSGTGGAAGEGSQRSERSTTIALTNRFGAVADCPFRSLVASKADRLHPTNAAAMASPR